MTPLWSIVLAGGRGRRLAGVTGGVPKQFWAPPGSDSLLEETLARIEPLTEPSHVLTVVNRAHESHVERLQQQAALGTVVYQPDDRGTATGVLLATTLVSSRDPHAVVLVTPSDHGVTRPAEFHAGIEAAAEHVRTHPGDVVLLGVRPSSATGDYGWIVPVSAPCRGTSRVASFVEKPSAAVAERLLASGAVWNTMVLVAKAEAILSLYRRHAPDVAAAFEFLRFLSPAVRDERIVQLYDHLPSVDLSHDVLTRATGLLCMTWGESMGWTDLGTPERLEAWLARARHRPADEETDLGVFEPLPQAAF